MAGEIDHHVPKMPTLGTCRPWTAPARAELHTLATHGE